METFAVEMCEVVKKFPNPDGGEISAVDHVDLQIEHGEFFSLLGPTGCGKTTSLRIIAGFEWPTEGEICIKGQAMGRTPPYLRPVNTVFQSYALFQHMTVAPNPKHPPGGQRRRVALARALVKRPAVLLLDEPLGALDLKLRKEMQLELKALQMQVGITFIYVTHDEEEALTMSDRIALMNKGKVLQIGTPVEIYERPTSRFAADFIGVTNFLLGSVVELNKEMATIQLKQSEGRVTGLQQGNLVAGQPAILSIRPEKIRLSEERVLNQKCFQARGINTTYIGSDTRVVVDLGQGTRLTVWEQNKISILDKRAFYTPGQEVWVTLFPENALVLADA